MATTKAKTTKKTTKATPERVIDNWTNVSGLIRIYAKYFKNRKDAWFSLSTSVSKKLEDDGYINSYYDVMFKKGEGPEELEDGETFYINCKKGFLTCKADKSGLVYPAIMVMEYEYCDEYGNPI